MKKKNFYKKIWTTTALLLFISVTFTACSASPSPSPTAPAAPSDQQNVSQTPGPAPSTGEQYSQNTITVNSTESVTVVPDIAEIIFAVRTEAKDASSCQKTNSEDVGKVTELLKGLGIDETSIQTSDYYMYPVYNYSGNTQRITGYEATTALTVSDIPIDNLGTILEQSVTAGINNIQSITYQSSSYDEGYAQALKLAVASAKTKAEALAQAGSCSIGNVVSIYENSNYSQARYTDTALSAKMRSAGAEDTNELLNSNIMPGEINVEVNITVAYTILY